MADSEVSKRTFESEISQAGISVSVGDRTTERIHECGLAVNLEVVDYVEKRELRSLPDYGLASSQIFRAANQAGTISEDALEKLSFCLNLIGQGKYPTLRLVIEGEEDLLVLPVAAFFPSETVVFYGQPNRGLVIVKATEARDKALLMLKEIGVTSLCG